MTKLEKIERQEQKTREKISAMQTLLKNIGEQRTEQENLQIVQQIRALKLSREELYAFINGGELPPSLAGLLGGTPTEPESIHSRRDRKNRNRNNTANEQDNTENPDQQNENHETQNLEGEEFNHGN